MWRELIRGERLGDGTRMRREVRVHSRESAARISGAIIHGRVVSLHALGNRSTELLTVLRARDALTFRWIAQKAGLEKIEVQVEPYHLVAGEIDPTAAQQWKLKLEIARPTMVRALGSEKEADEQIRRFMDYLRRPDTLTYSNVFTITGKKPV